ncbi:MAG TPA: SGNH/GDSL hydrolase family protein, partial [Candidatus Binataceae bacterium]|nr:SGNH/GDSL hydrolase family protein [Candidatus Binataceae bacterium]
MLCLVLLAAAGITAADLSLRVANDIMPRSLRRVMRDLSRQAELLANVEEHPFLQYTRPRTQLADGDQEYGFRNIKMSDVPKPAGMVRIACLGGMSTEGGYPELLRAYLDDAGGATRFQVLNFGIDGWSSVHSMLNFILNVREFRPDVVVVRDELRSAFCSGYPCSCGGRRHDYTPRSFRANLLDRPMVRHSALYRAMKAMMARGRGGTIPADARELRQYRRNIETICTLAEVQKINVVLVTLPRDREDDS